MIFLGEHTFRLYTKDSAGNVDLQYLPTFTWFVDAHAPDVRFDGLSTSDFYPYGTLTNLKEKQFFFSANEDISTFKCRTTIFDFTSRKKCCSSAFSKSFPECVSHCLDNTTDIGPSECTGTSNKSLTSRLAYSICAEAELRGLFANIINTSQTYPVVSPWETCTSPYTISNLGTFQAYLLEVSALDVYGNDGSQYETFLVDLHEESVAIWFWSSDPIYISPEGVAQQLSINFLNSPVQCIGVSQPLIMICIVTWFGVFIIICSMVSVSWISFAFTLNFNYTHLLKLSVCLQLRSRYVDYSKTIFTFEDEKLSYTDAVKIMRDTTTDLVLEV